MTRVLRSEAAKNLAVPHFVDGLLEQIAERGVVEATGSHFALRGDPDRCPRLTARPRHIGLPDGGGVIERLLLAGEAAAETNAAIACNLLRFFERGGNAGRLDKSEVLARVVKVKFGAANLGEQRFDVNGARSELRTKRDDFWDLFE